MPYKAFTLISTTLIVIFSVLNANAVQMTISYEDKEQPPYYLGTGDNIPIDKPGVAVEMVKMLENKLDGLKITLKRTPWKRCTLELSRNTVDGIFNASYRKERLELGWYPTIDGTLEGAVDNSRRITTISYSLYVLRDSKVAWDGKTITGINDRKVGAPLGYSIVDDLLQIGVAVEEAPNTEMNLRKLLKERISAAALQNVTADGFIKSHVPEFEKIKKIEPPLVSKHYYLMLSNKFVETNPKLAQKIWDAIKEIREAKFEELVLKYNDTLKK
ncbi:MAG: transporter substrate-binding domain-containing protein [Desulfamplus sp.]|nr:transporter substrate-binding domain-containing protein [Desulfamplus sp.]